MAAITICSDFEVPQNIQLLFPHHLPWSDGTDAMILVFWMLSFKPTFSLSFFTFIKKLLVLHFLPQSKSESEVAQLCPTLCNPVDSRLPGSSIHENFQARILEWVSISFSRGSSQPRDQNQDQTWVSSIAGRLFIVWATRGSYKNSAIRVVSSAYLRLLIFLLAILIPAYASSSPAFLMMYSAYKLNKQGDNIQPWHMPFPIWNRLLFHVKF